MYPGLVVVLPASEGLMFSDSSTLFSLFFSLFFKKKKREKFDSFLWKIWLFSLKNLTLFPTPQVTVSTNMTELKGYLDYLCKSTNMKCLTPARTLEGFGDYMAANLYARSIFGEDALANLSIEKPLNNSTSAVVGHIRIRAKSQVRNSLLQKSSKTKTKRLFISDVCLH